MKRNLSCHCGEVKIEVNSNEDLGKLIRCNCSICKRKGSIMAAVDLKDLKVIKGFDKLKIYQFHSKVAEHYFCINCGIYTHHKRRSNPNEFAINVGCIEEIEPQKLFNLEVINNDGQNHLMDKKK